MLRQYKFTDNVFKIPYYVIIGDDSAEIVEKYQVNVGGDFDAMTFVKRAKSETAIMFAFVEYETPTTHGTIAHEAFHGMCYAFDSMEIKINTPDNEHAAYYMGFLVDEIWAIIEKHGLRNKNTSQ